MFATSSPKTGAILLHCSSVCIATLVDNIASKNISGYQIPASYYAVKWVTVFGETGGDSLFYSSHRTYYNFSSLMPKTVKNCSTVNHSTRTATSAHDTRLLSRLQPQQFIHSLLELSRKFRMFVSTVIDNGGVICLYVAGIFYAWPLPIHGSDTPVWSVNAPTAVVKVTVNGKGRNRFSFSDRQISLQV